MKCDVLIKTKIGADFSNNLKKKFSFQKFNMNCNDLSNKILRLRFHLHQLRVVQFIAPRHVCCWVFAHIYSILSAMKLIIFWSTKYQFPITLSFRPVPHVWLLWKTTKFVTNVTIQKAVSNLMLNHQSKNFAPSDFHSLPSIPIEKERWT